MSSNVPSLVEILSFLGVTFLTSTLSNFFNKSSFIGFPKTSSSGPNTSSKYFLYSCLVANSSGPFLTDTIPSLLGFISGNVSSNIFSNSSFAIGLCFFNSTTSPDFLVPDSGFLAVLKTFSICFCNNGVTSPNSFFANSIASSIFLIPPDLIRFPSDNKNLANAPISNMSSVFVA